MSAGFGFSVGDFVAAIKLVGTVLDALRNARRASREFAEIVQLLSTLEVCLIKVKEVGLEDSENPRDALLCRAGTQCRLTIQAFWTQVRKYQPHLQSIEHSSKLRGSWMRVRWTLCKQEDVVTFKAEIQCQVVAIELALSTLQLQRQTQNQRIACKISDNSLHCVEQLVNLTTLAQSEAQKSDSLLEVSNTIMRQNQLLVSMLEERQGRLLRLPAQVERQQPVYLRDALDKDAPFHLEFVRSAEALLCVLRINLAHVRAGPGKVDRGEFSITENGNNRAIDLSQKWEACFFPGQRVGMSMLFYLPRNPASSCPACGEPHHEHCTKDTQCSSCGATFRTVEIPEQELRQKKAYRELVERHKRQNDSLDEDVYPFRRIQVVNVVPGELSVSTLGSPAKAASHTPEGPNGPAIARSSRRTKGCLRVVERQALCHCILFEHATDHAALCTCFGDHARITTREVLVSYTCAHHPSSSKPESPLTFADVPVTEAPGAGASHPGVTCNIPTPPSSLTQEPAPGPPSVPGDGRRAVCEPDTPPETPDFPAQAPSDAVDPTELDLLIEAVNGESGDFAPVSGSASSTKEREPDVRTYRPATVPVAIPFRGAREVRPDEGENSRSWEAGSY